MGEKRATDHLEPAAKKRGAERQIAKEDPSDDEEESLEVGTFARASADVLAQRKIRKVRRGGEPAAPSAPAATAPNPFQNVQLAASAPGAAAPAANPFAGISLVAPKPAEPAVEKKEEPTEQQPAAAEENGEEKKEEAKEEKAEEAKEDNSAEESKPDGGFGGLLGTSGGFGNLTGGFGGFASTAAKAEGGFGSVSGGFAFGAASTAATKDESAPAVASVFGGATASGTPLFGAAPAKPAVPVLPDNVPVATGEESEDNIFEGTALLFEWNVEKREWKERGGGTMKLNVNKESGQTRMVMRQKDTGRLLLNANLWTGMKLTKLEGGKGFSFMCVNDVVGQVAEGGEGKGTEGGDGEKPAMTIQTFALKLKSDKIDEFETKVKSHGGAEDQEAV